MSCRAAEIAAILAASPCVRAVLHIANSMSACKHDCKISRGSRRRSEDQKILSLLCDISDEKF